MSAVAHGLDEVAEQLLSQVENPNFLLKEL
jgi:hypothetical protein